MFSQIKSNQVNIGCYQEEYRRLTSKSIKNVFYKKTPVNQSLRMQNKWKSSVKKERLLKPHSIA